jgi:hypothetical protein
MPHVLDILTISSIPYKVPREVKAYSVVHENLYSFLHDTFNACIVIGGFWIGLTDALVEGRWVWETTQTPPSFTDWSPGEPNDAGHHEDCAYMYSNHFHWNDTPCNGKMGFICEKE